MKVYGLCGEKSSGKNTFASFAKEILGNNDFCCAEVALADPLKKFCIDYLGLPSRACYGSEEEKNATFSRWGEVFNPKLLLQFNKQPGDLISGREVLQVVGTEIFRGSFLSTFWIDIMTKSTLLEAQQDGVDFVFITDVRFKNEVDRLNEIGAKVIRIKRNIERVQQIPHASELEMQQIPESKFSHIIVNNGTLAELKLKVSAFLETEELS